MPEQDEWVTAVELGEWLGLSDRSVRDLAEEGFAVRVARGRYDLRASIRAYVEHLREVAAGRASADGAKGLDLVEQRARLAKEQADGQAMKNARDRGLLLPRDEVNAAVQSAFARVRARLLAIPAKAAPLVFGARAAVEIKDKLTDLVHEALAELAGTKVVAEPGQSDADLLAGDGGADGRGSAGVVAGPDAAAETDGEPVGRREPQAQPGGKRRAR